MAELKVGLLGCGGMGLSLATPCHELPNSAIVAVCDTDEKRAQEAGDKFGASVYTDYAKLISEAGVGAVIVASPPFMHRPMVERAVAAGKHVLCEKPMAPTVADCNAMIAAGERAGVKLMVAQVLRYVAAFSWLREKIGSGEYGEVLAINIERIGGRWGGEYGVSWRLRRNESGGNLMEINAHELDFMRCLAGDASRVYAVGGNYICGEQDYEDLVFASITFKSGAVGWLHSSSLCHAGMGAYTGRVQCSKGTFFIENGFSGDAYIRYGVEGGDEIKAQRIGDIEVEPAVQHEVRLFVEAVLSDTPVAVPGSEGRAAVELAEAAYRSIAEKRPIDLPL